MQSPLIDIIMNYASDTAGFILNGEKDKAIREIFQKYINHMIDETELMNQSISLCNSSAPAEKLVSIIMTEKEKPLDPPAIHNKLSIQTRRQTRSWSTNEDNRLLMAIHKYGNDNWNKIALFVGNGRSRSQCSQRWIRVLDPKISKNHWSEEEEALLIDLVKKFGNKNWMKISVCMGNRSDVQCRYRYRHLLQKQPNTFEEEGLSEPSSSIPISPKSSTSQVQPSIQSTSFTGINIPPAVNPTIPNTENQSSAESFNTFKPLENNLTKQAVQTKVEEPSKSHTDKNEVMLNSFFKDLFNDNEIELLKDDQYDDIYSCFI